MSYSNITASQLSELMRTNSEHILIDCRSFLVYNKGHISSAVNVRCNSIMKRRNKGVFSLDNAITNGDIRKDFQSGRYSAVIVYDDLGGSLDEDENLAPKSKRTSSMVLTVLQKHAPVTTVVTYLRSGYKEFLKLFPERCTECCQTTMTTSTTQSKETPCTLLTPAYDQGMPVEILPHLYLGSAYHASQKSQLELLGITAVLNASSSSPNYFENELKYKRIPVEDNCQADISSWFNEAINFINDAKSSGKKVLVHCHAGVSRSATICLAYLIACHRATLTDAFQYVKCRRSVISPNLNFMGQLLKFESDVAAKNGHVTGPFQLKPWNEEEMKENLQTDRRPRSQNFNHLTTPLGTYKGNAESNRVQTAPPCFKEFNFLSESKLISCSRESSDIQKHSRQAQTLTLST